MRLDLTVVLPALDEEQQIERTLAGALAALPARCTDFEVVVVDDGSRDGTAARVQAVAVGEPRVRLVSHGRRSGYGAALRTGFAAARRDWVLVCDSDGQFDLRDLDRLAARAADADLVVGRRAPRRDPWRRRALGAAWSRLVRAALPVEVRDVNCGFKLIRRELLARCDLRADGTLISAELLVAAARAGARIVEVAVPHHARAGGRATGADPAVALRALRELWRLRARGR